jgi:hypothetical protein
VCSQEAGPQRYLHTLRREVPISSKKTGRIAVPLCAIILWAAAEGPLLADASYKETTQITGGSIVGIMKMAGTFSRQPAAPLQASLASNFASFMQKTQALISSAPVSILVPGSVFRKWKN